MDRYLSYRPAATPARSNTCHSSIVPRREVVVRIGLIGDTHGYVSALEAAIAGCRDAGTDRIIHCGDFLSSPFSPDSPDETIALLRAEDIAVISGNGEIYGSP